MVELSRRALAIGTGAGIFAPPAAASPHTAFDFSFEALEGGWLPLSEFQGRVLMVVNTASFCAFAPQFAALQRLHEIYAPRGLTVLGVPSDDFHQEAEDAQAVRDFCDTMFGITFPMANLTPVRGQDAHPFFLWAARRAGAVRWNFHKYLVSRDGQAVAGFASHTAPDAPEILRLLEMKLAGTA